MALGSDDLSRRSVVVALAQLVVEHWIVVAVVTGSILYVACVSNGAPRAPLLLLCVSRPELGGTVCANEIL